MSTETTTRDWHDDKHACPPGLLKDAAFGFARRCSRSADLSPADTMVRARAIEAWLAKPFAVVGSGDAFWRAVKALDLAIEDHRVGLARQPIEDLLKIADDWVVQLAAWSAA